MQNAVVSTRVMLPSRCYTICRRANIRTPIGVFGHGLLIKIEHAFQQLTLSYTTRRRAITTSLNITRNRAESKLRERDDVFCDSAMTI